METTVRDVNLAFAARRIAVELPYPEEWRVLDLQILEKREAGRSVRVLLAVELLRDGERFQDLCYLEGEVEHDRAAAPPESPGPLKTRHLLPLREETGFQTDAEALGFLREAFSSLLQEHDYRIEDHPDADLYGALGPRGFFLLLAVRCDAAAAEKAERLVGLRRKHKHLHDYGLVVPAFQEPLGVPLSRQETWVAAHADRLSSHRVGVYGVDNADPNRIYPFTVYPQVRGLLRYFVATSRQWQDVRTRYLLAREGGRGAE